MNGQTAYFYLYTWLKLKLFLLGTIQITFPEIFDKEFGKILSSYIEHLIIGESLMKIPMVINYAKKPASVKN